MSISKEGTAFHAARIAAAVARAEERAAAERTEEAAPPEVLIDAAAERRETIERAARARRLAEIEARGAAVALAIDIAKSRDATSEDD